MQLPLEGVKVPNLSHALAGPFCSTMLADYGAQVKSRNSIVEIDHPRAGKVRVVGVPVRLSATPGSIREPAPAPGEHTAAVLRDLLGLGAEEIAALRSAGALG